MGEAVLEAPAAGLAVRVLELHAVDQRVGLDRELLGLLDEALLERRGRGDDLERGPGRLGRRERDPRQGPHLGGAGVERRDPAEPPGQGGDRRLLHLAVDGGVDVSSPPRTALGDHASAREQPARGPARQLALEHALEAGDPDRGIGVEPAREDLAALLWVVGDAHLAGDRAAEGAQRRDAGLRGALGQHLAVDREDAAARRRVGSPAELLPGAEAREEKVGRPLDPTIARRDDQVVLERAEDARSDSHGHRDGAVALAFRIVGVEGEGRGRCRRVAVGALEVVERIGGAGRRRQQGVHRGVVAALPGRREAARRALALRLVPRARHDAGHQRHERDPADRGQQPLRQATAALGGQLGG